MKKEILIRWIITASIILFLICYQITHNEKPVIEVVSVTETQTEKSVEEINERGPYRDGIFTGSGIGYGGDIIVEVSIENGYIVGVNVISADGEDKPYLRDALGIIDEVIANQNTELDAISGATHTTWGILDGIDEALIEAVDE